MFSSLAVNAEEVLQEDSSKNVEIMDSMELLLVIIKLREQGLGLEKNQDCQDVLLLC